MVNKEKTHRMMIQISKRQYEWLLKKSNELEISISQLIRWLLNKKIKDINDIKKFEAKPKETIEESEEEFQKILKDLE